jgi:glucose/arabinose dehydrogenase
MSRAALVSLVAALLGCVQCARPGVAQQASDEIALREIVRVDQPVWVGAPPGDPRLFLVEQPGVIRIFENGKLVPEPFLDLRDRVRDGGERGLLSLAFHPKYPKSPYVFVNYTDRNGDTTVERYTVGENPNRADRASAKRVIHIAQPYANHNGGLVMFGPDGMLYVGMGDGGSAGDPQGNGQDRSTLLGDLLRLDIDLGDPYAIPRDNPFVGQRGMRGEIWAWGLRNPWRFCFDPPSGLLYIADVGQNKWEEIDVAPARRGGLNYGWNLRESAHPFRGNATGKTLVDPVVEYSHGEGCSVTGGYVYRGKAIPSLVGRYVYADYCSQWIRSFRYENGQVTDRREYRVKSPGPVSSFGVDGQGELYVCSLDGPVLKIVSAGRR